MKRLIILILLLLLTVSVSAQRNILAVKQSYDRFKDETAISLWIDIKPNFAVFFVGTFSGKKPTSEITVFSIGISARNKELLYRSSNDLDFLLDGKRLGLKKTTYSVERSGTTIVEDIGYIYLQSTLKKIIDAKKIEAKIGDTEFTFTNSQLEAIRDFYKRLVPVSASIVK